MLRKYVQDRDNPQTSSSNVDILGENDTSMVSSPSLWQASNETESDDGKGHHEDRMSSFHSL